MHGMRLLPPPVLDPKKVAFCLFRIPLPHICKPLDLDTSLRPTTFAEFSGGAIFHSGFLRVSNATFVANLVGKDGPAIMSIGLLKELSNVSFLGNAYRCPAGQYGYILDNSQVKNTGVKLSWIKRCTLQMTP